MKIKSIAVFCGAHLGNDPIYEEKAKEISQLIASKGINVVFGGGKIEIVNDKGIISFSTKKVSFNDLLTDCNIGLSTVLLDKTIINENLFPPLKTKEDYTAWLKLTKNTLDAYNFPEY